MSQFRIVLEKCSRRGDVFAFARGLRRAFLGLRDLLPPFLQSGWIGKLPQLMVVRHGLSPIRDRALAVSLRGLLKRLSGLSVLKRVQQGQALLDCPLHFG